MQGFQSFSYDTHCSQADLSLSNFPQIEVTLGANNFFACEVKIAHFFSFTAKYSTEK